MPESTASVSNLAYILRARALSSLPVKDLTVENPPLEEVMSELFARSRAAREEGQADGESEEGGGEGDWE